MVKVLRDDDAAAGAGEGGVREEPGAAVASSVQGFLLLGLLQP